MAFRTLGVCLPPLALASLLLLLLLHPPYLEELMMMMRRRRMRMLLRVNGLRLHCIPLHKYHFVVSLLFVSDFSVVFWGLTRDWTGECVSWVEI